MTRTISRWLLALATVWTVVWFASFSTVQANASEWKLAGDFSIAANPNGAWSYGSSSLPGLSLDLFTDSAKIPPHYGTLQLQGWTDPKFPVLPYALKNVSGADWVYDGTSVGGGIAVLAPGEVLLHPYSPADRSSVARWTAPHDGEFSIDAQFQRIEQVAVRNSEYHIFRNGVELPGAGGALSGYCLPSSSAHYLSPLLALSAGDAIDFVVGFGTDGSDTDGTVVAATITSIPEPLTLALAWIGVVTIFAIRRWRLCRRWNRS